MIMYKKKSKLFQHLDWNAGDERNNRYDGIIYSVTKLHLMTPSRIWYQSAGSYYNSVNSIQFSFEIFQYSRELLRKWLFSLLKTFHNVIDFYCQTLKHIKLTQPKFENFMIMLWKYFHVNDMDWAWYTSDVNPWYCF